MTDKELILLMIQRFGYEVDYDRQVLVYTGFFEDDNGNIVTRQNETVLEIEND